MFANKRSQCSLDMWDDGRATKSSSIILLKLSLIKYIPRNFAYFRKTLNLTNNQNFGHHFILAKCSLVQKQNLICLATFVVSVWHEEFKRKQWGEIFNVIKAGCRQTK